VATLITEACIDCGLCAPECPNEAIAPGPGLYLIDPRRCSECVGFHDREQCAEVCPVDCCVPDPNLPEPEEELFRRARRLHPESAHDLELGPETSRFRREP